MTVTNDTQKAQAGQPITKPAKGTAILERRAKVAARGTYEDKVMREAKQRDGGCRFPRCFCKKKNLQPQACHLRHRGMGGNPKRDRTTTKELMTFCQIRHDEWERGEFVVVPQDTLLGFNGLVDFYAPDVNGRLECFASEKRIGVSVAVGR